MRTHRQHGLSLVEMMIALTIGLVILAAMTSVFVNSSHSQMASQNSAQQIENGRYALDQLTQDLHLAGYFGQYSTYSDGTTLPDPCDTSAAGLQSAVTTNAYPVQGITALQTSSGIPTVRPDLSGTTCTTYLPAANLYPGSDILVVRRVDTSTTWSTTSGGVLTQGTDKALNNEVYMQSNQVTAAIQIGNGNVITTSSTADGGTATILTKGGASAAPIYKYLVHIYFVAPCSRPKGGGSVCTGANDDGGSPIPTLKMLELSLNSANTLTFNVIPIAEGVEAFKVEYGIDNSPTSSNATTGRIGDGVPDLYIPNSTTNQPGAADYPDAVSIRLFLVTRDSQPTQGYTDNKVYPVATSASLNGTGLKYGPYGDAYKRHGYDTFIRLENMSSRREIP
ncbi:MAG: PilW family protein [Bacillota bacterium]